MAVKTLTCPSCHAALRLDDSRPSKAVRCPKCKTTFKVPQGDGVERQPRAAPAPPPPPAEKASTPPPVPTRTRPAAAPKARDVEPAAEGDRPSGSGMRWVLIGGGGGVLALALVVALLYFTGLIGSRKAPTPAGPEVAGRQEPKAPAPPVVETSASAPAGPGEKVSEATQKGPEAGPGGAPAGAPRKTLDLSFVAASFNGALVIHPVRMARSPVLEPFLKETGLTAWGKLLGIDPRRIEQVVIFTDPFPGGAPPAIAGAGAGSDQAPAPSAPTPAPGGRRPAAGKEFTWPEARFSVRFPSPPKETTRTDRLGNVTYVCVAKDAGSGVTYNVEVSDVPKNALVAGPEFYLKSMADILGKGAKSKRDVKAGDYPGFEVVTEPPGLPVRMTMRIYVANGRQYQLMVSGPKDKQDAAQVAAFFDSFKPSTGGAGAPSGTTAPPTPGPGGGAAPAGAPPARAPQALFSFGVVVRLGEPADGKQVLTRLLQAVQEKTIQGKTYYASTKEKVGGVPLAGFPAADRTLVVAPEPTLHKMLTAGSGSSSPLRERLARVDLDNDVVAVVVMEPFRVLLREMVKQVKEQIPPPLAGLAQLPDHLQVVEARFNLSKGALAQVVLETNNDQSAAEARQLMDTALGMARQFYPPMREQLAAQAPPEAGRPILAVADQLYGGVKVSQVGQRVVVQVDRPEGFGEEPPKGLIAVSGFNDDKGLESNRVPGSPFPLGSSNRPGGAGELGWAGPWPASPKATFEKEVVFEGDGALHVAGTENYARRWTVPQKGVFQIEQQVRVPKGSSIACYVWKSPGSPSISTGPMWRVAEGSFKVLDGNQAGSGPWLDTGVRCEPDTWYKVTVRVDVAARHWEFFVGDQKFQAPHPLGFRFPVDALDGVNYLTESPPGFYLDALIVRTGTAAPGQ